MIPVVVWISNLLLLAAVLLCLKRRTRSYLGLNLSLSYIVIVAALEVVVFLILWFDLTSNYDPHRTPSFAWNYMFAYWRGVAPFIMLEVLNIDLPERRIPSVLFLFVALLTDYLILLTTSAFYRWYTRWNGAHR